jgi:hypothetical protein
MLRDGLHDDEDENGLAVVRKRSTSASTLAVLYALHSAAQAAPTPEISSTRTSANLLKGRMAAEIAIRKTTHYPAIVFPIPHR